MKRPLPLPAPIYVTRPLTPPLAEYAALLESVWSTRWFTNNGALHQALEGALAAFLGTPNVSLFDNGTIALIVACQALELTGEVITTPFTFPATPHVLHWNKLTPYPLCSDYDCYRHLPSADRARLPVASRVADEVLALPFFGELTDDDVSHICEAIRYVLVH